MLQMRVLWPLIATRLVSSMCRQFYQWLWAGYSLHTFSPTTLRCVLADTLLDTTIDGACLLQGNTSQMLDYVRVSFKERLDNNTWIDNTTRNRCKEKVDAVSTFTSYPDQLFSNDYLNNLYAQVSLYVHAHFFHFELLALTFLIFYSMKSV